MWQLFSSNNIRDNSRYIIFSENNINLLKALTMLGKIIINLIATKYFCGNTKRKIYYYEISILS